MGVIFALLFFIGAVTTALGKPNVDAPIWSETYAVKGILHIPYAEIHEPFYAWYDAPSKQSRIDYYGDMVKTYQLGSSGYGTSLKIAPITTETEENAITCLQVNGTEENKIVPQTILPSLVGFECAGSETIDGVLTEKWALTQTVGQKVNKYTMWIFYKPDPNNENIKLAVPKRYEMRGFNSLLGSHYDHYFLEYDFYDINEIPKDTFEIDPNMTCSSFPGPGDKHIYTFNPMAEFIHPVQTGHVDFEFNKFMHKHRKQYGNERELNLRKEIFRQNIRFIHAVNRQNRGYSLTVNHLADKTELELKALRGKTYSGEYNGGQPFPYKNIDGDSLPTQFDWRIFGAVTPVKDQSVCGSCWSFGTVGTVEGAYFLKNGGNLVRLSQQALIDCSWGYGNNGCDGGEDFRAYKWMLKHGGIPTEEDYGPYLGQDGYCHAEKVSKVAKITGWVNVTANDENALRLAIVKHGPISVAIDASHRTFSFYSNGVYYEPQCGNKEDQLDHAVLAVGYGSINGKDYWLIKNSWSNYWGNDGYVLMAAKDNNCGVMTTPTYVTM
ncbi:digestive cysteine proteinase 1 [Anoplophora glabripennis]|uniref:digestive cysteine proteinase 1 n=1 Tax=Anoplophora glabripennis TaxID=217634 RepID=UPI000874E252|nr:digestive cysteine proteinase 1 [Anoplophora glabripennis]